MIKRITLFARRTDLDRTAFSAHWKGPHRAIAEGMPGVLGYRQSHVARAWPLAGAGFDIDGMAELWFADDAAMALALASPAAAALPADELNFMRAITLCRIEEGQRPLPGNARLIVVAQAHGETRGQFAANEAEEWLPAHALLDPRRIALDRVMATATRDTLPGAGDPGVVITLTCNDLAEAGTAAARIVEVAQRTPPPWSQASLLLVDVLTVVPPPFA